MNRFWIGMTLAAAMAIPCMAQARPKADASGAFKRLDQAKLAEQLQSMNMKEFVEALGEQAGQSTSTADLYVAAQCKANIAMGELMDLDRREKLLADALELTRKCVQATERPKTDEEYVAYYVYRTAYARMLAYDRCALCADKVMMLIGGDEDRKLLEQYTREVILGKDKDSKSMITDLLDQMQMRLEDWANTKNFMTNSPKVERAQNELKYYSAWIFLYRGLSLDSKDKQKSAMLDQAIAAAQPYVKNDDTEVDPAMLLLQGVARSEMGVLTKDEGQFIKSKEAFGQALSMKDLPDALKVNLQFQACCNLVRWGKFDDALKNIDAFPQFMVDLMGKNSQMTGDMRAALLKNFLFDSWAKASAEKGQYDQKAQQALVDFIIKYSVNKVAVGDFLKILAQKYRGETDFSKLPALIQFAVGRDHFDKYAELYQIHEKEKGDAAPMDAERKKAMEALNLVSASGATEVKDLKPQALEMLVAMGGDWADVAEKAMKAGTKEALINAAVALQGHIEKQDVGDIGAVRLKLVQVLEALTGNAEYVKDVRLVQPWFYTLGEQYRMLSQRGTPDEQMIDLQANGIAAFAKVPATDPRTALGAKFEARRLEFERLMALHEPSMNSVIEKRKLTLAMMANDLVRADDEFVSEAKDQAAKADAPLAKDLRTWAGLTQYHTAVVLWEVSAKPDKAKQVLAVIRKDFKDTPSALDSWVYQIRRAVEMGQTTEAIDGINQIQKEAPEQATALMANVISQIQVNINKLRNETKPEEVAKLAALRKTYMEFAKSLLEKATEASKNAYEQLYADALLENGKADEALGYFTRLYDEEQKTRKAKEQEIDKLINARLDAVKGMSNEQLKAMATDFAKVLAEFKLAADCPYKKEVDDALKKINDATDTNEEVVKFMYDTLSGKLKKALEGMRRDLKDQIPTSLINLQGLARCNRVQKKYAESIKYYDILTSGLSRAQYPAEYWRAQLERSQCKFDQACSLAGEERTKALEYLQQWLNSYIESGKEDMGAVKIEFIALENKVKETIGSK